MIGRRRIMAVVLAVGLLAAGCGGSGMDPGIPIWDTEAHPDYKLIYDIECSTCFGGTKEVTSYVRDGEVVEVFLRFRDTSGVGDLPEPEWHWYPDLDDLFTLAELSDGYVPYDPRLGVPLSVETAEGWITGVSIEFDLDVLRVDLADARRRWEENRLDAYTIRYRQLSQVWDGDGDYVIEVRDGVGMVVSFSDADGGGPAAQIRTVDSFFDLIEQLLDGEMLSFGFRYHDEIGYPMSVHGADENFDGFAFTGIRITED